VNRAPRAKSVFSYTCDPIESEIYLAKITMQHRFNGEHAFLWKTAKFDPQAHRIKTS